MSPTHPTPRGLQAPVAAPAQSSIEFLGMSALVLLGQGTGSTSCPGASAGDNPAAVTFPPQWAKRCSATYAQGQATS